MNNIAIINGIFQSVMRSATQSKVQEKSKVQSLTDLHVHCIPGNPKYSKNEHKIIWDFMESKHMSWVHTMTIGLFTHMNGRTDIQIMQNVERFFIM